MDVSILRCYTLSMIMEVKEKALPVGFLDPELMSLTTITSDKSYVVDYVTKTFRAHAKKEFIMFAHNSGDHWILVVIPKWSIVLYFDSQRSKARDHRLSKEVIDEAFLTYCSVHKMPTKKLVHVTKFSILPPATPRLRMWLLCSTSHVSCTWITRC